MHIVVVTHYFPPIGGPGAKKIQGWMRGFERAGARLTVITPQAEPADAYYDQSHYSGSARVVRVPIWDVSRRVRGAQAQAASGSGNSPSLGKRLRPWLLLPDHRRAGNPALLQAARVAVDGPAVLLTTSPYNSVHLVGLHLRRELGDLVTWIADFRDDWMHPDFFPFPTALHRSYNAWLEGLVLAGADRVTVIDSTVQTRQHQRHPELAPTKWQIVPNGVDDSATVAAAADVGPAHDGVFRAAYVGTLWDCHNLDATMAALGQLAREGQRVEFTLAGRLATRLPRLPEHPNFTFRHVEWLPAADAIRLTARQDLCVVHAGPVPESMATKLFDAMSLRKPILHVGMLQCVAADLMRARVAQPLIYDDRDDAGIYGGLRQLLGAADRSVFGFAAGMPQEFDRAAQGEQLARWARQHQLRTFSATM